MKAVRFHQHGGPEVLRYEDAPDPVLQPGQALVRVRACALNHLDLWERRGIERVKIPLPHISGSDVAGEVADGPTAEIGRRVLLQPGVSCGRCQACLEGRDNFCRHYDVLGYRSDGGYAELVTVPVQNLVRIPDHLGFPEAAAFPLTFLTAWHMLVSRAGVKAGEQVLVLAAGSGVGQAAIQIARLHGAHVLATAGSDRKLALARELGAEAALDHHRADLVDEVRKLTDRRGVDVVVEHVGQQTWDRSLRCLAPGGRLVTCGATTGPAASLDLRWLFGRQLSLLGSYMGAKGELLEASRWFFDGKLRPVLDESFPLALAADAQRRMEDSQHFGKIVLEV
ncbi:MAG: zinc-binding dehydrogenase [Acidobacteria bacterium]|nr:zinc-binding dehydrogenase [Acidobacteriota bacterium]MBI3262787.1 zinc-binding dehydrogenase [Acidobacteriota bacterium]